MYIQTYSNENTKCILKQYYCFDNLLLWVISSTTPPVQTTERPQWRQRWSSSRNRMSLFTKHSQDKFKTNKNYQPYYTVGISQSPIEANHFFFF